MSLLLLDPSSPVATQIGSLSEASVPVSAPAPVRNTSGIEAPAEITQSDEVIKFDSFDSDGEADSQITQAPEVEELAPTEPAPEPSQEQEPSFELPQPKLQVPQVPLVKGARDYNGLSDDVRAILSELHNTHFNRWRSVLPTWEASHKRVAELEAKLATVPEPKVETKFWFDHPQAYSLTPEYSQASGEAQQAEFERNAWASQLARIEAGEKWQELEGYDKQGRPFYKVHEPLADGRIDSNAKAYVIDSLTKLGSIQERALEKLRSVKQNYSTQVRTAETELRQVEDRIFPAFKDEAKLPKEQLDLIESIKKLYPSHMQSHPAIRHVAKSYLGFQNLAKLHTEVVAERDTLKKQLEALTTKRNFARAVPRPVGAATAKDATEDDDEISFAKLNAQFED